MAISEIKVLPSSQKRLGTCLLSMKSKCFPLLGRDLLLHKPACSYYEYLSAQNDESPIERNLKDAKNIYHILLYESLHFYNESYIEKFIMVEKEEKPIEVSHENMVKRVFILNLLP
jgi:hypothetical protein